MFSSLASLAAISSFPFPEGGTEQSSKQEYPWGEPKIGESGWGEKESPAVKPKHFTKLCLPTNREQFDWLVACQS